MYTTHYISIHQFMLVSSLIIGICMFRHKNEHNTCFHMFSILRPWCVFNQAKILVLKRNEDYGNLFFLVCSPCMVKRQGKNSLNTYETSERFLQPNVSHSWGMHIIRKIPVKKIPIFANIFVVNVQC